MKKIKYGLLAGLTILLMGCLTGCMNTLNYTYQNGEKYTAGDRNITENIEQIDINYLSGNVHFSSSTGSEIGIKETANKSLDEDRQVHSYVDGSTLYIRYCASANSLDLNNIEKSLEISVPQSVTYKNIKSEISSGSFSGNGIKSDALDVIASSGDVDVDCTSSEIGIKVSSGTIVLKQHGKSNLVKLEESSGSISANVEDVTNLELEATSGNTILNARNIDSINYKASSGDGDLAFDQAPKNSNFNVTSGGLTISLPENSSIKANINTSSGDINYDLPFNKTENTYTLGSGANSMNIEATSGDVKLKRR